MIPLQRHADAHEKTAISSSSVSGSVVVPASDHKELSQVTGVTEGSPGRQWSCSPQSSGFGRIPFSSSSSSWLVGRAFNFLPPLLIFSFFPNGLRSVSGVLDSGHHLLLLLSICSIPLLMLLFFCLRCYCCYPREFFHEPWRKVGNCHP